MSQYIRLPLVKASQEKKYIIAIVCFLFGGATVVAVAMLLTAALLIGSLWVEGGNELVHVFWHGKPPYSQPIMQWVDELLLPVLLLGGVLGFFYGYHLWDRLFVKSGYLDAETVQRMMKNMAPTERMEKARKALGFMLLIPFFSWLTWVLLTAGNKGESELWRLMVLIPSGLVVYLLYHAWREYFSRKNS